MSGSYSRSPSSSGSKGRSRSRSPGRKRNHSPAPRSRRRRDYRHEEEGKSGNGTISSLNERGFGFIRSDDRDDDFRDCEIYFHCTALGKNYPFDDLKEGDAVEYTYVMDEKKKKPRAKRVRYTDDRHSSRKSRSPRRSPDYSRRKSPRRSPDYTRGSRVRRGRSRERSYDK